MIPDSTIHLMQDVPLLPNYKNTLWFDNAEAQKSYFNSKIFKSFSRNSYLKMEKNVIKVNASQDDILTCCYMQFQNSQYSTKWFYAFIDTIEYVNDSTALIYYTLDILQTWHFDYEMLTSFVEREHSATDKIHTHTIVENVEKGEYFFTPLNFGSELMNEFQIYVVCSENLQGQPSVGKLISGVYTACDTLVYDATTEGVAAVNNFISNMTLAGKANAIISISMIPKSTGFEIEIPRPTQFTGLLETPYTPKNNKLYTMPYQFAYVSTSEGELIEYPFEYFLNGKARFKVRRVGASPLQYVCTPLNYKGLEENVNEEIVLKVNNLCSWNIDTFKNWLAYDSLNWGFKAVNVGTNAIIGASSLKGGGGVETLAGLSYINNTVGEVGNLIEEITNAYTMPPQLRGQNTTNVDILRQTYGFRFGCGNITAGYANLIDNFFNKFGYKTIYNKIPNRNVRENYTFVKTVDCNITGNIPIRHKMQICGIYNNGVTFWKNPQNFGNYSVSNKPLSEEN